MSLTFAEPMLTTLGWTLLHFLWQGALIALGYYLTRQFSASPRVRYAAAGCAMILMAMAPVATFLTLTPETPTRMEIALSAARDLPAAAAVETAAPMTTTTATAPPAPSLMEQARRAAQPALPWIVAFWLIGVAGFSLRAGNGLVQMRRLRRSGAAPRETSLQNAFERLLERSGLRRRAILLLSDRVESPMTFGWLKPVVLLPFSALSGLQPAQVEALLLHELAHVRRCDYLVNLFQTAVETLLFYHPAVWWVSNQMRVEREHCCDDAAAALCGDSLGYARALTRMETIRQDAGLAMAANGGKLMHRISRLVAPPARPQATPFSGIAGAIALTMTLFLYPAAAPAASANAGAPQASVSKTGWRWEKLQQKGNRLHNDGRNGERYILYNIKGWSMEARWRGRVRLAADDQSIEAIVGGGFVTIRETDDQNLLREIRYVGQGEALNATYWVDGVMTATDSSAAWLRELLPLLTVETGLGAYERAARILREQGPAELLAAIREIDRNTVKIIYFAELTLNGGLSDAEMEDTLPVAREEIKSEGSYASFLVKIAPRFSENDRLWDAYLEALAAIKSNGTFSDVMRQLTDNELLEPVEALSLAQSNLSSQGTLADLLRTLVRNYPQDPDLREAVLQSFNWFKSQGTLADLFIRLDEIGYIAPEETLAMVERYIASQGTTADTLIRLLAKHGDDPSYFEQVLAAAQRQISSQGTFADFTLRLHDKGYVDYPRTLALGRGHIQSQGTLADFLVRLASKQQPNGPLGPEFIDAIRSISSGGTTADLLIRLINKDFLGGGEAIDLAVEEIQSLGTLKDFLKRTAKIIDASDRAAFMNAVRQLREKDQAEVRNLMR